MAKPNETKQLFLGRPRRKSAAERAEEILGSGATGRDLDELVQESGLGCATRQFKILAYLDSWSRTESPRGRGRPVEFVLGLLSLPASGTESIHGGSAPD